MEVFGIRHGAIFLNRGVDCQRHHLRQFLRQIIMERSFIPDVIETQRMGEGNRAGYPCLRFVPGQCPEFQLRAGRPPANLRKCPERPADQPRKADALASIPLWQTSSYPRRRSWGRGFRRLTGAAWLPRFRAVMDKDRLAGILASLLIVILIVLAAGCVAECHDKPMMFCHRLFPSFPALGHSPEMLTMALETSFTTAWRF